MDIIQAISVNIGGMFIGWGLRGIYIKAAQHGLHPTASRAIVIGIALVCIVFLAVLHFIASGG